MCSKSVGAGEDFDERAEIGDTYDFAEIRLAHFGNGRDVAHHLQRAVGGIAVGGEDVHCSVVRDVDLDAGLVDDSLDHLAAGSDQLTDLIGRNLGGVDARRILRQFAYAVCRIVAIILSRISSRPLRACSSASA